MGSIRVLRRWLYRTGACLIVVLASYGGLMLWYQHGVGYLTEPPEYPEEFVAGTYQIGPEVAYSPGKLMQMCFRFGPYCSYEDTTWTLYVFNRPQSGECAHHLVISAEGQDVARFAIPGLKVQSIDSAVPRAFRAQPPPGQLAVR